MTRLRVGTFPDDLSVEFVTGEAWTGSLQLKDADTSVEYTWPAAPVLTAGPLTLTGTLGGTSNSVATWTASSGQVATLATGQTAKIQVSGVTWWLGSVLCRP